MRTCIRCGTPYGTHVYEDHGEEVRYCVHCKPTGAERVDDDWPTVAGDFE